MMALNNRDGRLRLLSRWRRPNVMYIIEATRRQEGGGTRPPPSVHHYSNSVRGLVLLLLQLLFRLFDGSSLLVLKAHQLRLILGQEPALYRSAIVVRGTEVLSNYLVVLNA